MWANTWRYGGNAATGKNVPERNIIGKVITFPKMFLSGTFFPVAAFPPNLQVFAHILPLYYVIDGMNKVMLFNNPGSAVADVAVLAAASVVVFVLAILAFKWRDE